MFFARHCALQTLAYFGKHSIQQDAVYGKNREPDVHLLYEWKMHPETGVMYGHYSLVVPMMPETADAPNTLWLSRHAPFQPAVLDAELYQTEVPAPAQVCTSDSSAPGAKPLDDGAQLGKPQPTDQAQEPAEVPRDESPKGRAELSEIVLNLPVELQLGMHEETAPQSFEVVRDPLTQAQPEVDRESVAAQARETPSQAKVAKASDPSTQPQRGVEKETMAADARETPAEAHKAKASELVPHPSPQPHVEKEAMAAHAR